MLRFLRGPPARWAKGVPPAAVVPMAGGIPGWRIGFGLFALPGDSAIVSGRILWMCWRMLAIRMVPAAAAGRCRMVAESVCLMIPDGKVRVCWCCLSCSGVCSGWEFWW